MVVVKRGSFVSTSDTDDVGCSCGWTGIPIAKFDVDDVGCCCAWAGVAIARVPIISAANALAVHGLDTYSFLFFMTDISIRYGALP
jgi:hypothetical protein